MSRLSDEILSSIIGDIYDCALSPEGWTGVMTRITSTIDAAYTTIALTSVRDSRGRFAAQSPWDAEQMRALQDYEIEAIPGLMATVVGDIDLPQRTLSVVSEGELEQSAFFQEWAKPQGLREACTTKFVHTADRIGLFSTTTWANRPPITDEEQRFLALLSPHLRRASLIGDLLDQTRVTAGIYRGVLDSLAVPVILAGADGAVLHANAHAAKMLDENTLLRSRNGVLQAQTPIVSRALLEAIAAAAHADAQLGSRGIGLPISAPGQSPAVAYVLPLSEGTARAVFRPACAAVFISTTISASPPPEDVLITLYDLTPAEARVVLQIGRGLSSAQCIAALAISENTLKTHLGRIFAKTSTARQADLVALVSTIASPIMQGMSLATSASTM
ncbi:LuxR family transcriptional regulator [Rhizobium leguminosarum bv. trifolii]|uniref:LuxR family transcriptional regulator n=1 Tax=Rhizobium leguminosarum bv. trifolii TaxID=386 RepID=A0A3E1BWJ2_RHILT|nr:helix-turn-helix transcriptional regulator [Rhizobium leguminosarum]RFB98539.1 LuxR family transcriptional regulator [Rhizobium leguminosarum bv. trifolii]RFB99413.1 LuxR family transcriptional regulator [Rhizobium leguminosarum bv. trifolii]